MENRMNAPSADELMELVEKQDSMIECLMEKLEICNEQIRLLQEVEEKRRRDENEATTAVAAAQEKIMSALATIDVLQAKNEKLEKELDELKKKSDEEKPIPSVIQLRSRVKELEFELLREQRASAGLQNDIDFHKARIEQLQREVDSCNSAKINVTSSLSSKLEDTVKELTEFRVKYQSVLDERDHIASELGGEVGVLEQRSAHLQAHCERLSSEISKLRKECRIAESRVATLVEENTTLRRKVTTVPSEDAGGGQMQRLMKDQSHLIAALREEGKILLDQLEVERKEYKVKVKSLKKEKREVEERLEKLLSV